MGRPERRVPDWRVPDWRVVALAGLLLVGGAAYVSGAVSGRYGALYLLGGVLGLVLYHAAFGFASGWRAFIAEGRGANLRAQMLMLALASAIFLPVLDGGSLFGRPGSRCWSAPSCSASACNSAAAAPRAPSIPWAAARGAWW